MKITSKHTCLGLAEIDHAIVEALRYSLEDLFPEMMQTFRKLQVQVGHLHGRT